MAKYVLYILLIFVSWEGLAQNTSNLSGSFDIGPVGNATYNIPVDLPPGTAGLKPDISIVYNSFSGDGVMGKGFSLSAISSITRANTTVFHNGYISDIKFDNTDKYMLDGNRLMYNASTNQYRTEMNPYSQIKIVSPNTSSAYFEVKTKEGLIMEYGNTSDSKLYAQGAHKDQVAFWMLNKVKDRIGNYYTYTYEKNDDNGEIRLKQIDYTGYMGSANRAPYCSVKFAYTSRNHDVNLNYIAGSEFEETKLLSEIGIYYGAELYRRYTMTYNYDGNDLTYLLSKITVTGQNNETLKPIVFNWYKNTDFKHKQVVYDQSSNAMNYINKAYISLGDYNGDGRTDLLATPMEDANWTGWRLFLADTDGNKLTYSGSGTLPERYKEPVPGDYNGDGITDFLACRETVAKSLNGNDLSSASLADTLINQTSENRASVTYYNYFVYYGTGNGFTAGPVPAITTESRPHGVRVADFNGDGAMDLFVYYKEKNGSVDYKICMSGYSGGTLTAFNTIKTGTILSEMNWDQVEVWDFNGDGLAEVINFRDDGYDYMENNGAGSLYRSRTGTFPNKKHKISFGDFNGDRKIDLLLTGWNDMEWSEWQTLLSTGSGFKSYSFPKKFNTYSKDIYVCDLNGDGNDDFFAVDKSSENLSALKCFIGYDNGRNFKEYSSVSTYGSDKWNFFPLDTRGDGKLGFLVTSAPNSWKGYQLYMPNAEFSNLLKSATDSHGNVTSISYKKMPDTSIYTKTPPVGGSATVFGYDSLSFTAPFKLVSEVSISNGIGGTNSIAYTYENAKVFKRGRGFLGFTKTIMNDLSTSVKTTITQSFSDTYYQAAVKSIEKIYTPTNRKLTQTNYTNTLTKPSNAYGTFVYQPTSVTEQTYEPTANKVIQTVTTNYSYDDYGNLLTQTATYGNGDVQKVTNTYSNNTADWLIGLLTRSVSVSTVNSSSQTNTVDYSYYSTTGLLHTQTVEPNQTAYKSVVTYTYDEYGNVATKTKTVGNTSRVESYKYVNGRFVDTHTDVLGQVESFIYEPVSGLMSSHTDINGDKSTYTYDGFGKIKTQTSSSSPGNNVLTSWTWTNGNPSKSVILRTQTAGDGQVVKNWYDALGREIQSGYKNFSDKEILTVTEYDALGRAIKMSEPYFSGSTSSAIQYHTSQYDNYGRISKLVTPLGTITYSYSGNQTTINDGTKGYTTVRETDTAGRLKSVTDPGGKITYTYGPSGDPVKVVCGSVFSTISYDLLGRRTELKDPNAGIISYTYDGWGNLNMQTDARGETEEYVYDNNGLLKTYKRGDEESFSYTYDSKYKGQVGSVVYGGVKTAYTYGDYGRLESKTETVENKSFQFLYSYNTKGQLETMTYPNSKSIKYEYTNGDLYKIIWQPSATTVWQKSDENAKGQVLSVNLGNGMQGSYTYNTIGVPTSIRALKGTTPLLNIGYQNNDSRGNIRNRKDLIKLQGDDFTYDNMNRLVDGVEYDANGNITYKWDAGTYEYDANHPHAVRNVSPSKSMGLTNTNLSVKYNSVRLPIEIKESDKKYTIIYNGENSRIKSQYVENNSTVFTKYYSGPYEEIQKGSTTRKNYYIYAGGEIAAVYTEGTSDAGMYYYHNDHLGSPWLITNASGVEVQRLNFNAWGRRRDVSDWSKYSNLPEMKFDRGFTGHEHLEMFGLINMNARLYDPVLGRFLSPDPIIQVPDFTQSYNGYSYAMNNPLSYKDPNGESFILVAAIIGGWIGMGSAMVSSDKSGWGLAGDMFKGLFVGAASGAAGAWAGGAIAGSITAGGFIHGSLSGLAGGFGGGFVGCSGNAWLSGAGFGAGLKAGFVGGALSAAFSGISGGLIRGFTDMAKGYSFWDGSETSYFVIGQAEQQANYKDLAKKYNKGYAEMNDAELKTRMIEEFNVHEGDMGIDRITTKAGNGLGMSSDGVYMNNQGDQIAGLTKRYTTGKTSIRISPKYAVNDILDFKAIAGHELIHAYHYNTFGTAYDASFSESVAYRYSVSTYVRGNSWGSAFSMYRTAMRLNYWIDVPKKYMIPKIFKYTW